MLRLALKLVVFVITGTSFFTALAEDWPQFRGPTGQGLSAERRLPVEWSSEKNVAWKMFVPGLAWSSPVVWRGQIYLTSALTNNAGAGPSLHALCLEAKSGRLRWDVEVFTSSQTKPGAIHGKNSHASPTPVIENDRLYVHFGPHGTAGLDLNGKVLWRKNLGYPPVHGSGGSPAIVEEKLAINCDGATDPFIVALSKRTGDVIWKVARQSDANKKFSFSTPLVISVGGHQQIITAGSGVVNALDPSDGREIWRVHYGQGYSVVPRPVFGQGLVFVATGFDRPSVLAIRPDGQGDVTATHVAWTLGKGAPNTPSLLLADDELYMVSDGGIASCVDAKTGKVHWQERVGGNHSASPVYADGRLYLQSEDGVGTVLKAGREFVKLASNPLSQRTLASYAVADGAIFIRTAELLYRIQNIEQARP
ncbi:MAG: PQQ-like beta-propeller repeat protein [Verrucomicrobiales bacterium]|nr:PQQ-like beta-propeller repeat protein [Verrucomicrobiales bacterium]